MTDLTKTYRRIVLQVRCMPFVLHWKWAPTRWRRSRNRYYIKGWESACDHIIAEMNRAEHRKADIAEQELAKETCMCGSPMKDHDDMWAGHSPVSMHDYHRDPDPDKGRPDPPPAGYAASPRPRSAPDIGDAGTPEFRAHMRGESYIARRRREKNVM